MAEGEIEVEIDAGIDVEVDANVDLGVEIDANVDVEMEVEVDDPMANVEGEVEVEVEVEIDGPEVEIEVEVPEVEINADAYVEVDLVPTAEIEVEIEAPVVDIDISGTAGMYGKKQQAKKKPANKKPLIPDRSKPYLDDGDGIHFVHSIFTWLAIQAFIEVVTCIVILCLPRGTFAEWVSWEGFDYLLWGSKGLIILGLCLTLPECAKSAVMGIVCWVLILLGGLMYFGLISMRNNNQEGNVGVYYLSLYLGMIMGLMGYFKREEITYETCQVFPYIIAPQILLGIFFSLMDSHHSGMLLLHTIIVSLFGLSVKVSCEMIITNNKKKLYKRGQEVSASQKMFTDLFVVFGECIFEGFEKDEEEKDIAITFE